MKLPRRLPARARSTTSFAVLVTCHLLRLAGALGVGGSLVTASAEEPLARGIQDNSFFIEEAYNQEPGVVQHIFNAALFIADSETEIAPTFTQEWPIFTQTHQFSYTIPYVFAETDDGLADIRLNYRLQALMEGEHIPAFAPRFSFVLPTGDADKGFGHDRLGYEINLPFSKIVADPWSVHFNAGGSIFPDVRGRDLLNYNLGGSAIYAVTRDFNLMLESIVAGEEDVDVVRRVDRSLTALVSPGARYAFNFPGDAQLVVGLGVPIGLTADSPDWGVFFYCSFEHPFARRAIEEP